jgi:hypothetical protein
MRNCVLAAAAVCLAVPAFAQNSIDVTGRRTLTPTMVMCANLPVVAKPPHMFAVKDVHATDLRLTSYPKAEVLIGRSDNDNFQIGQRFISSREYSLDKMRRGEGFGDVRPTGVVRITAVNQWHALAVVDLACDTIHAGDFLDPYVETTLPTSAAPMLDPDFDDRAQIIFGNDSRTLLGDGDVVSIDRGTAHGVTPGARFAIYRDKHFNGLALIYVGEAVVMTVGEVVSKVVITKAVDGVYSGDTAVPRRLQPKQD